LVSARYIQPLSISLQFADRQFTLEAASLGMPVDRIRWDTAAISPTGDAMTVRGIKGETIPIDSSTLRYLVDPSYAAKMDAALKDLQFSRAELEEMARDNQPPVELLDQAEQDLTSDSWK
jgi:hypothetical protein